MTYRAQSSKKIKCVTYSETLTQCHAWLKRAEVVRKSHLENINYHDPYFDRCGRKAGLPPVGKAASQPLYILIHTDQLRTTGKLLPLPMTKSMDGLIFRLFVGLN